MSDYFAKFDRAWSYRPVFVLVCACLLTFFVWAFFTEVEEHVRAVGRIVPSGKTRLIQHLEGGIINEILVREGESVKKGDILFYIKNQRAESELQELGIALSTHEIKKRRLEAELNEGEVISFTDDMIELYPEIVQSERSLFATRNSEFKENVNGLEKRMKQRILKLDEMQTNIKNLKDELSVAREQLAIKTELRKKGAISKSQYLDVVSTIRDFKTRISKIEKEIPITKSEIAEITNLIEETRQKRFSEVGEELNKIKIEMRKFKERIETLDDEVDRTAIRSPVDGVVNKNYVNTIGGVVQPGGNIAEIIPVNENLIVEGRISTNDRGKVWPGLPVVAKITAYDYTLYGGVYGDLVYISANSFSDNNNNEYYQVRASLDTVNFGEENPVYPGMVVDLSILSGKISVLHVILKPFLNIKNNALREK